MQGKLWGNEYRLITVCVDSYQDNVPVGRICHPVYPEGKRFMSLMQFFHVMEQLLDEMKFPQAFDSMRSFRSAAALSASAAERTHPEGKLATFAVRVIFRQNASWQGTVTWLEGEREESFRSAMELAFLMDSVLSEE